jgi:hypothetical protein
MTLDLTAEQQQALAAYLRRALDAEKYRLAPALLPIKEVLAMLEPPKAVPPPPKPAQSPEPPSRGRYAKRRG